MSSHQNTSGFSDEPLSPLELAIIQALPRAAKASPDSVLFKIPKSSNPHDGFVDTTCAQASSIVARLANNWSVRLSKLLDTPLETKQGTVVAIGVQPEVHAWFHHMAFWALGCGVQYFNTSSEPTVIESLLKQSGCSAILTSGKDVQDIIRDCGDRLGVPVITLSEEEHAINLAKKEQSGVQGTAPAWPNPCRPTPAIILQTSATTNSPKLLRFPMQHWALTLEMFMKRRAVQEKADPPTQPQSASKRPRILVYPLYWMTSMNILLLHLVTHTPLALVHKANISSLSSQEILDWLIVSNANHVFSFSSQAREMLLLAFDENGHPRDPKRADALTSLESIAVTGSNFDLELSDLFVKCGVKATNTFGNSELGQALSGTRPPYTYLRPVPGHASPLITPFEDEGDSEEREDQSTNRRLVQLWTLASTHPHLSRGLVQGHMPVDIEPYPGAGSAHGQAAVKWGDLFYELEVPLNPPSADGSTTEKILIYAGRVDDNINLSTGKRFNASQIESALKHALDAYLRDIDQWTVDAIQIFGTNRPHAAVVVQLRSSDNDLNGQDKIIDVVRKAVDEINKEYHLSRGAQIDAYKRLLIISTTGERIGYPKGGNETSTATLALTHKRTIQRWKNNQRFEAWLDEVCR